MLSCQNVTIQGSFKIDFVEGTMPREDGDICIASYMNFLITNDGVIVPQYGDENDCLALEQVQTMFPDKKIVGVNTVEVVYGAAIYTVSHNKNQSARGKQMSKIVIALGGNALGNSSKEQLAKAQTAAKSIVDLIEQGHQVVIAHGNGPQVGKIA